MRNRRDDAWVVLLGGLLLLGASLIFMVASETFFLPVLMALATAAAVWMRRPLPGSTRTYVWTPVACVLVAIAVGSETFFIQESGFILPTEKYAPIGIGIGMAALFLRQSDWTVAVVVTSAYLTSLLCGAPLQITPGFRTLFLSVALVQLVLFAGLMMTYSRWRSQQSCPRRRRVDPLRLFVTAGVALAAVGLMFGLQYGFFAAYRYTEQRLPEWMMRRMQPRGQWFERTSDLWRPLPAGFMDRRGVTLRVESKTVPGYLRGYAFDAYSAGKWQGESPGRELAYDDAYSGDDLRTPFIREAGTNGVDPARRMTIYTAAGFKTKALLVPGVSRGFRLVAESLAEDGNGALEPELWERVGGYVVDGIAPSWASAAQADRGVGGTNRAVYLSVPAGVTGAVVRAVDAALEGRVGTVTARETGQLIEHYFQMGYRYELGVRMQRGKVDPVEQFLETHRAGHCELFASATVLMLRQVGIPARYVTGCMAMERHPSKRYWVARENSAHAWVEAYDVTSQSWFLVEPTPPDGRPASRDRFGWFAAQLDLLRMRWSQFRSLLAQGALILWIMEARDGVVTALLWLVTSVPGIGLILSGGAAAIWWARRQQRARRGLQHHLRHLLYQLERTLSRTGHRRRGDETLREFADRIAEEAGDAAGLLRRYEALRYNSGQQAGAEVAQLEEAISAFCKRKGAAGGRPGGRLEGEAGLARTEAGLARTKGGCDE